ncbi:MAG: hypothetical protein MUE73_15710 [Planctomycetes bacterium]|jgi:hypothetical protein|nr:hypothetical protein [Planctomycetota bacterium]
MRRVAIALVLSLLACSSPEENVPYVPDFDTEIAQAAQIGDPPVLRVYSVRDLVAPPDSWPGEDISLAPSGGSGSGQTARQPRFERSDGLAIRLSNFIPPNRILRPGGSRGEPMPEPAGSRTSDLPPNSIRMAVGENEELPLRGCSAQVRIDGFRARVILDLAFENDRDRTLEGTFQLRLPEGASPFRLAFGAAEWTPGIPSGRVAPDLPGGAGASGVPGLLKEARMVRREKAVRAYHETVRRRVDPALLEWAGGGVFSARVFPLDPNRIHRVVIGYDLDLVPVGDNMEFHLGLPAGLPGRNVTLTVARGTAYEVEPPALEDRGGILHFTDPGEAGVRVRLPAPGPTLLTGADPDVGDFFAARLAPEIPDEPAAGRPAAVFLVDVSLSANPDGFALWRRLLPAILRANRDSIREFAVLFFDIEPAWWREGASANTESEVEALLAEMDGIAPEGATDLGAALRAAAASPFGAGRADFFLLSDGASNWGDELPREMPGPVFAYRTGQPGTDVLTLETLARETGGAVFAMAGGESVEAAAGACSKRPWRIRSVAVDGGTDILLAGRPTAVYPGQILTLAGRGRPVAGSTIRLTLARDDEERTFTIRPATLIESPLAPRVFGEIATAQLEALGSATEMDASAVASHFRVVGRTCSLLMLETEEDYRRQGIEARDDGTTVRTLQVDRHIAEALDSSRRESEKERFLAWLRTLADCPGVHLELPEAVWTFADALPESVFESGSGGRGGDLATRGLVPDAWVEALSSGRIAPDDVVAEANRRLARSGGAESLRVLSSLVEMNPGDTAVAREVAYHAMERGLFEPASRLLRRTARARPFEPESFRALALCHEAAGEHGLARLWIEVALAGRFDDRFAEFRRVVAFDAARFIARTGDVARRAELEETWGLGAPGLVVVIVWNSDGTDVDLHVTDPRGEECSFQHTKTAIGGSITRDVTAGFGPEIFLLPEPVPGVYEVAVTLYSTDRNRLSLRTTVLVTVIENVGRPSERVTRRVVALSAAKEAQPVVRIVAGREE